MELLQLRYFLDSAENENFSKTAEKYRVPPSSVSIAVKRLETELGKPLFTRRNNRIELNAHGRVLRNALRRALEEIDGAVAVITDAKAETTGDIRLLIRAERRVVSEHLMAFKEQYPQVAFHLVHDFTTREVDRYDIIIDEQSDIYQGFDRFPMLSEAMRFAACKDNPLCTQKLTLSQLRDQSYITMGEGSSLKRLTMECCQKGGFRPNIIIESDDPYYLRKYIELDLGIALIPEMSWKGEMSEKIVFLDVVDFKHTRITYAYLNRSKLRSAAAVRFYEFLASREKLG